MDLLDKYLARCLQSSSTLQLLGCACLFIASKNCEYSIVASECYVIASCNVFSKSDLFAMETKVVSELADDGIMQANFNILRLLRYVNWKLTIPSLKAHEF